MTYCNLVPKFLTDFQYWERKKTSILYVQALHEKPNNKNSLRHPSSASQTNKFIHQVCQLGFKKGALLTVVTESQRFDPFYVLL